MVLFFQRVMLLSLLHWPCLDVQPCSTLPEFHLGFYWIRHPLLPAQSCCVEKSRVQGDCELKAWLVNDLTGDLSKLHNPAYVS